jgi:hypothetical protein
VEVPCSPASIAKITPLPRMETRIKYLLFPKELRKEEKNDKENPAENNETAGPYET